jgi:hypothetical protein
MYNDCDSIMSVLIGIPNNKPSAMKCFRTLLYILFSLCLVSWFSFAPPANCGGKFRWDYKIMIDHDGLELFKSSTVETSSVGKLVKIERPTKEELHNKRAAEENRKVTITCFVTALGNEDDEDYHLVIKSLNSAETLIAEIPDPDCPKVKKFPGLATLYRKARAFVDTRINVPGTSIKPLDTKVKVKITGVPFFDKVAHGSGHAPNGIEIHPILSIRKVD